MVNLRVARRQDNLEILDRLVPHAYVVRYGVLEQDDVLVHDGHRTREHAAVNVCNGNAVEQDLAFPGLVQPGYDLRKRGLAATRRADERHAGTRLHGHGKILDDGI